MIIKKLELQGFKSFAERAKIAFHPGITAIVGPNGTGKSNLVDAILWVLGGARIKSLRGDRTEDIIFNGNAKHPALSMADVTLSLGEENEDLVVSHRVFRSGESEYRLNGKSARLKDIQDELWKHAIGETGYFVIEQGAIGNFVTSKPSEKRALLEEAAGTAYYKDKKRQAQNKLESSEQNLVRLEDIIAEVERARNSLQRQAQAANRYRRLRERIRELTAFHYQRRLLHLEGVRREAASAYDACLAREQEAGGRVKAGERELAGLRHRLWDLEKSIKETRERVFGLRTQSTRLESEIERETKRIEFFDEKRGRDRADSDDLLREVVLLVKDLEEGRAGLEALAADRAALEKGVSTAAEGLRAARDNAAAKDSDIRRLRDGHLHSLQTLTESRNEAARVEKELELLLRQEEKLSARIGEEEDQLATLHRDLVASEAAATSEREAKTRREAAVAERAASLAAAREAAEGLRRGLDDLSLRRERASAHLAALSGVVEARRDTLSGADLPGGLGLLADLVRTSPEDAPLFDVFWKEEARARVVSAEDFLRLVRAETRGSFLLIPDRARAGVPAELLADPDVAGLLKSRVTAADGFQEGLRTLEDAVVVRGVAEAVRLWLRFPDRHFITASGDLLLSSGLLRLGERSEGIIALTQEIRGLEQALAALDAEFGPAADALEARTEHVRNLERELESERAALAREERALLDRQRDLKFRRLEGDRLRASLDVLRRELDLLREEKSDRTRAAEDRLGKVAAAEADAAEARAGIEAEEKDFSSLRAAAGDEERRYLELRSGLDLLDERMNSVRERAQAQERRKAAAITKIDQLEADARSSEEEKARLRELIADLGTQAKARERERQGTEESLAAGEKELQAIAEETEGHEAALARTRAGEEGAKDERVKREIGKAEIERDLINLEETCWQDLKKTLAELRAEMTAPAAPAGPSAEAEEVALVAEDGQLDATPPAEAEEVVLVPEDEPEEAEAAEPARPRRTHLKSRPIADMTDGEVEAELEETREALNRFKAVNLMAEEEFAEQKKRHEFLVEQRRDLRESISSTAEAIRKIDQESQDQFLHAVGEVNKNFLEIFSILFKGGNAEVKLLEPDNPLESGVEIVAQPPGKRVQNLSLLSGGEKTLTSLAFMFALFRYKPSPFCFLDEVDAALDDVNLARFLDLMRQIKAQTQFIIITHNYRTMEVADYIYGTTMDEPNITKIYSVKFERKDERREGEAAA
jgi:chromosome segregation protein